ncbi:MAG: hypothetical protein HQM06_04360 [Magnetococcales bacterium]|nr:hypothetical protein [Magnetococcales bacterium]
MSSFAYDPLIRRIRLSSDGSSGTGFSSAQIAALADARIHAMTLLPSLAVAALTTTQVAGLTSSTILAITASQHNALTSTQIAGLTSDHLAALTTVSLSGLSSSHVHAMGAATLSDLNSYATAAELNGYATTAALATLTTTQMSSLGTAQIAAMSSTALSGLTSAQIAALSTAALAGLSTTQIQAMGALTLSSTQTVSGEKDFTGQVYVEEIVEKFSTAATAASGTVHFDILSYGQILEYTSNASGNWTLNIRGDATTALNAMLANGESITIVFDVQQGVTAYYLNSLKIDGNGNGENGYAITSKWQGGTAPVAGNPSSCDSYTLHIRKTADKTFSVRASIVRFA